MNFIYITTNLINNKQYVGSHKGRKNDTYLGSGTIILKAIKKYGKKNFKRIILEECDVSINLLLEEKYIKEYNTLIPNGYNISPTGGALIFDDNLRNKKRISLLGKNKGRIHSKEIRKKMSEAQKGKKLSIETKQKMSEFQKGRVKSVIERKHLSESKMGSKNPMYGKIPWNKKKKE